MLPAKGDIVGCALGGGGARGLCHIGVLKAMEQRRLAPGVVAGTSMGALVGALYASGLKAADLEKMALEMGWQRWAALFSDLTFKRGGILRGNRVLSMLSSMLGDMDFSELRVPFACVATDIRSGCEVVLTQGPVAAAVRASVSIPGLFTPARVSGRYLVDGGLVNEVPVNVCRQLGATYVIGVSASPDPAKMCDQTHSRPPSLVEVLAQSMLISGYQNAAASLKRANLAVRPAVEEISFWQFGRAAEIIELGETAAREVIDHAARHAATPAGPG